MRLQLVYFIWFREAKQKNRKKLVRFVYQQDKWKYPHIVKLEIELYLQAIKFGILNNIQVNLI